MSSILYLEQLITLHGLVVRSVVLVPFVLLSIVFNFDKHLHDLRLLVGLLLLCGGFQERVDGCFSLVLALVYEGASVVRICRGSVMSLLRVALSWV